MKSPPYPCGRRIRIRMKHKLYSELRTVYETTVENPHTFRVTVKTKDMVDGDKLRQAAETAVKRYPYFLMKIGYDQGELCFEDNGAPFPVINSDGPITLGGDEANGHLLCLSWWKNKIHVDVYHALTDGGGIYNFIKTLLYYYCSDYYGKELSSANIRLAGDPVDEREWEDPADRPVTSSPFCQIKKWSKPGFQIADGGLVALREKGIVYNIRINETEFMRFNLSHDGSPGTIVALFLARAIEKLHPEKADPVVIAMCVNQRKALKAPLAHQSLVGDVRLVYGDRIKKLEFKDQATAFRGMVALQSDPDIVMEEIREYQEVVADLKSLPSEADKHRYCIDRMNRMTSYFTATVSYVGNADMGDAEYYIQEFHALPSTALPSSATPLTLELSAMNGSFYVNFMQFFEGELYLNAFIQELRDNDINYDVLYQEENKYPRMIDLWSGR